jgi:hypothetical protein
VDEFLVSLTGAQEIGFIIVIGSDRLPVKIPVQLPLKVSLQPPDIKSVEIIVDCTTRVKHRSALSGFCELH